MVSSGYFMYFDRVSYGHILIEFNLRVVCSGAHQYGLKRANFELVDVCVFGLCDETGSLLAEITPQIYH